MTDAALPFEDTTDFENADRGFVDALDPAVVKGAGQDPLNTISALACGEPLGALITFASLSVAAGGAGEPASILTFAT